MTCKRCFGKKEIEGIGGMKAECPDCSKFQWKAIPLPDKIIYKEMEVFAIHPSDRIVKAIVNPLTKQTTYTVQREIGTAGNQVRYEKVLIEAEDAEILTEQKDEIVVSSEPAKRRGRPPKSEVVADAGEVDATQSS